MKYTIYRETETKGCTFSDGSDTRKTTTEIVVVPKNREEDYQEHCISQFESQDYSYQFSSVELIEFEEEDLNKIRNYVESEEYIGQIIGGSQ